MKKEEKVKFYSYLKSKKKTLRHSNIFVDWQNIATLIKIPLFIYDM